MVSVPDLQRRCMRLERTLQSGTCDEIVLLRTARELKSVYASLQRLIWMARKAQRPFDVLETEQSLTLIENQLRIVLLTYPAVPTGQMREYLNKALDESWKLLDIVGPDLVVLGRASG